MASVSTSLRMPGPNPVPIISDQGMGVVPEKRGRGYWKICVGIALAAYLAYITIIVVGAYSPAEEKAAPSANATATGSEDAQEETTTPGNKILEKIAVLLIAEMATILAIYGYRFVRFCYEGKLFYESRYNRSLKMLFDSTMMNGKGDLVAVFIFFGGLAILIYFVAAPGEANKETLASVLGAVSISSLTTLILGLAEPTRAERSENLEGNNYNIATGMAWNYFTGYLQLILQYKEDDIQHRSLRNVLKRVGIADILSSQVLLLLVPDDCICPPLMSQTDGNIKAVCKVKSQELDRAGVKNRVYSQTIYQIHHKDSTGAERYYYCCCENITAIDTFYQMDKLGLLERDIFQEQLKLYVGTIRELVKEYIDKLNGGKQMCRIVTYSGDKFRSGVGDLLVQVLKETEPTDLKSYTKPVTFPSECAEYPGDYQYLLK